MFANLTREDLMESANKLKQNYRDLVKIHYEIEKVSKEFAYFDQRLKISEIGHLGEEYTRQIYYPNGLEIYAGMTYIVSQTSLEQLRGNSSSRVKTLGHRDFFLLWRNGLNDMIGYSLNLSDQLLKFYLKYIYSYKIVFFVICIVGIFFTFTSLLIIIPIVTMIYSTNRKVLSLFGSITPHQIEHMISICSDFKNKCLMTLAGKITNYEGINQTFY